jgi:hypothetical protein
MEAWSETQVSADEIAHRLYQALAASGHAAYCPAQLGPLYDESAGRWGGQGLTPECSCGRDDALAAFEAWRSGR